MEVNVKEIKGEWDLGYSLDKHTLHSQYIGVNASGRSMFDTTRSEAGEALYQLKYKLDFGKTQLIAENIKEHIFPLLPKFSFIIAMPPSKDREKQPVEEIAKELADLIKKPIVSGLLCKSKTTPQMKDIEDRDERIKTLLDAFKIDNDIVEEILTGESGFSVLIIDDLFDTGTSLEAATKTLRECSKISNIYVATVTRTKNE